MLYSKRTVRFILFIFVFCLALPSISHSQEIILSQFKKVEYSDFLIDNSGTYHAVYTESPDYGKPVFVYYTQSKTAGKSWSKPIALSNDQTGNGSTHARLIQDKSGTIYAIWKRFGTKGAQYPIASVTLEGPGGYTAGTLFACTISSAGQVGTAFQVNERETAIYSWFPMLDANGAVKIMWSEISEDSWKKSWSYWYYADWMRIASLTNGSVAGIQTISNPSPPKYEGGAPPHNGIYNLNGYVDKEGNLHFICEMQYQEKIQSIIYFDGKKSKIVYQYPLYKEGNTFKNPARLIVDAQGKDHIIMLPNSSTLETDQIWDLDPVTMKPAVLVAMPKPDLKISGLQVFQGPVGKMAVCFESGTPSGAHEATIMINENNAWKKTTITKNSAKESFFATALPIGTVVDGTVYKPVISVLTRYSSKYVNVAFDQNKKEKIVLISDEYSISGGFSTSAPSLYFVQSK